MDEETIKEVQEWLSRHPIDPMWDHNSELSDKHVDLLLEGKIFEVEDDIWEGIADYSYDCEMELLRDAIDEFDLEIEPEELREYVNVTVDVDLPGLLRWSGHIYISVGLGVAHYPDSTLEYEDVADELRFWGVNPHDIDKQWPNIAGRQERMGPIDLVEAWSNCFYPGNWYALLDGGDALQVLLKNRNAKEFILEPGANVTIYSYYPGAGSTIESTKKPIVISRANLYHDGADRYGIQSCYGLVSGAWNGRLEAVEGVGIWRKSLID